MEPQRVAPPSFADSTAPLPANFALNIRSQQSPSGPSTTKQKNQEKYLLRQ